MQKPNNYENIQLGTALTAGKHRCVIKKAEETVSKTGLEMLIVYFDTAFDDMQPKYYENGYERRVKNNPDAEKWCRKWVITDSTTDYGDKNLKKLNNAVLLSNGLVDENGDPDQAKIKWGDLYCEWLKDKRVGVIFGEEEYIRSDHQLGCSVKPSFFCSYPKEEELGKDAPARKTLPEEKPSLQQIYEQQSFAQTAQEGFMQIPDELNDEGLPFH